MSASSHDSHNAHGDTHKATINGLAVIGFVGLLIAGMLLAIYASRYVPGALERLSSAVYLSSDKEDNGETPAEEEPAPEEETPVFVPETPDEEEPRTGGPQIVTPPVAQPPQVITTEKPLTGRADLALTSVRAGYFRGSTFVESDEVPDGRDMALKFTVVNAGTNVASNWRIKVDVEGERSANGNGGTLYPDGTQAFTLRVTNPEEGRNREISIEVDSTDRVTESNERNNDRTIRIDVENDN